MNARRDNEDDDDDDTVACTALPELAVRSAKSPSSADAGAATAPNVLPKRLLAMLARSFSFSPFLRAR